MSELTTTREDTDDGGRFVLHQGDDEVGEMVFRRRGPSEIVVTHTETSPTIRGMGGGGVLFQAMVDWARATRTRVRATCEFAKARFEKDESARDVYDP